MTSDEQRRLHRLVDLVIASSRAQYMTSDPEILVTMRAIAAAARAKIKTLEKEITPKRRRRQPVDYFVKKRRV
jgi:hypothetical protein